MTQPASAPELSSLKGEVRYVEPDRVGRSIARRSAEIRATVPHLELSSEVDVTAALALARRSGWSLTAVLLRACARALAASPWANAAYRDGHFELYSRVNVGVTFHARTRWPRRRCSTPTASRWPSSTRSSRGSGPVRWRAS